MGFFLSCLFSPIAALKRPPLAATQYEREQFVEAYLAAMEPILHTLNDRLTYRQWSMVAYENAVDIELHDHHEQLMAIQTPQGINYVAHLRLQMGGSTAALFNYINECEDYHYPIAGTAQFKRSLAEAVSQSSLCLDHLSSVQYMGTFQDAKFIPKPH